MNTEKKAWVFDESKFTETELRWIKDIDESSYVESIGSLKIRKTDMYAFESAFKKNDLAKIANLLSSTDMKKLIAIIIRPGVTASSFDVQQRVKREQNCLSIASRKGNLAMCKILVGVGSFNPNLKDEFGGTSYTLAYTHADCMKYLYSKGARVPGDESDTPFNVIEQRKLILEYNKTLVENEKGRERIQEKIDALAHELQEKVTSLSK